LKIALLVAIGAATVVGAELVRQVAARRLARRTGRGLVRSYFSGGWQREPLRGVPAMGWWLLVAVLGMLAFMGVGSAR
jgi:hypothetical protein